MTTLVTGGALDLQAAREAAERAAREAAEVIRRYAADRRRLVLRDKGTNELVSEADVTAQRVIVEALSPVLPQAGFLGEEEGLGDADDGGLRWIIDPIDGTTNFMHGVPPYAVSIGLAEGDRPLVGVVYDVSHDELFSAARGHGLTRNGEKAGVSETARLSDSLIATGFPYRSFGHVDAYLDVLRYFFSATRGVRRHGSAAVDLAWVACGRFDAFFEIDLSPWDIAAGLMLIEEGGGRCTRFARDESPLFPGDVIATNGLLHEEMRQSTLPLHGARP